MNSQTVLGMMDTLGLAVGFALTLALFTLLTGDRAVARLAQHLLVGATLGYLAVLAVREILQPRLFAPLWQDALTAPWIWFPFGLGLLLCAGGIAATVRQAHPTQPGPQGWLRGLHWAALLPVALIVGVGIAIALIGVIQGSLLPQLWRTIGLGVDWAAPSAVLLSSIITLLVTTSTLLALTVVNADRLARPTTVLYSLLSGWIWLGRRALWLAAGAVFARLAASYLSLLIGEMTYLRDTLSELGLWSLLEKLWS